MHRKTGKSGWRVDGMSEIKNVDMLTTAISIL